MSEKLLFLNLGGGEILVILLFVLLFFGSKRIPELAKGLGKGMREFKDAISGIENEVRNAASENPPKKEPPAKQEETPAGHASGETAPKQIGQNSDKR